MSIHNLMIQYVEGQYNHEYIANVFWVQNLAKVHSITLVPYLKNSEIYNIAYITIEQWCDSEAAYNFIQRLKKPEKEARIVYHEDYWWLVELNTHNDGKMFLGAYTVVFNSHQRSEFNI